MDTLSELKLSAPEWRELAGTHARRAKAHVKPARERKDHGVPHPIQDFLFQYYPFPLSLLESWHPGVGVTLEGGQEEDLFNPKHYSRDGNGITADPSLLSEKEVARMHWIRELLAATASRAPIFSCHGLHEWAMVYRGQTVRHEKTTRLRLPQSDIDGLVESRPICCSHHDAFRFFANDARPFNRLQPSLETRPQMEQPGCVHANMDLYKWAAKLMPWIGSDLLLDCFELAVELRELDMKASPYDLAAWDCEPIRIETTEGRRIYESEQRRLSQKAAPLRARLIWMIDRTLERRA
ncbi:MAG TPA: hypothetical protein VM511_00935 [Luteolibacter sp.]|nr:hypothetical protein [Luteolibacter sp.]